MTSVAKLEQIPSISIQELKTLYFAPGTLKVIVKQVSGYFLPYVQHTPPDGDTKLHGIIINGENVLATVELADIIAALQEIIGTQHPILTPDTLDGTTLH